MLSALDPTGALVAATTAHGQLVVRQGVPARLLWQHDQPVVLTVLAWSRDGTCLATGDVEGVISVWGARTGRLLAQTHAHREAVQHLAWAPTGSQLISTTHHNPRPHLWEYASTLSETKEEVCSP